MKPNLGLKFEMGKKAKKEENAKKIRIDRMVKLNLNWQRQIKKFDRYVQ